MSKAIEENVPSDKVDKKIKLSKASGATSVEKVAQPNGKFTIIATFDDDEPTDIITPPPSKSDNLAWGAKVSNTFRNKVRKIAGDLGCDPSFLMAAMAFETGETFSPKIKNPASGATGLIQFMPKTAVGLGTTTDALAKMSAENQLDFVAKYFERQKGKLHTLEDVYMAILLPTAVGKPNNHVLFTKGTKAYDQNKGLDVNNNGEITKAEAAAKVREKLVKGMKTGNVG
jgi:hypothetical protein